MFERRGLGPFRPFFVRPMKTNGFLNGVTDILFFRYTNSSTGSITYNFIGEGAEIYGFVSGNHAPFVARTDNPAVSLFVPNTRNLSASIALLYATNVLPLGNHAISIQNNPSLFSANASTLTLSYITIFKSSAMSSPSALPVSLPQDSRATRDANIIGASLGCATIATLIVVIPWCVKRRKQWKARNRDIYAARPFLVSSPGESPRAVAELHPGSAARPSVQNIMHSFTVEQRSLGDNVPPSRDDAAVEGIRNSFTMVRGRRRAPENITEVPAYPPRVAAANEYLGARSFNRSMIEIPPPYYDRTYCRI
ncbi:hypothetical protein DFH29DRAFT_130728 [Suillus ampliporus]|nr:hypothetical protein DFH29DRAFT_130728 [Suillus ampliporus]